MCVPTLLGNIVLPHCPKAGMEDVLARKQVRDSKRGLWEVDAQQLSLSVLGKHLKTTEMVGTIYSSCTM